MTSSAILIPARYDSKRFPGKPLVDLDGTPMIKRVFDTCKSTGIPTYVLTDDMRIFNLFGPRACWIDQENEYDNGTERCAGAINNDMFTKYCGHYDQFINVQGDMPDVTVDMIKTVDRILSMNYQLATLFTRMDKDLQNDPNSVKVVTDNSGKALWFGRGLTGYGEHHLGVYGYQRNMLEQYRHLYKHIEEDIEKLEQLRWIKNSLHIQCGIVEFNGIEINTPDDAEKWNAKNSMENLG